MTIFGIAFRITFVLNCCTRITAIFSELLALGIAFGMACRLGIKDRSTTAFSL